MAKLHFIKGNITGKIGEFVGSTWKGINYLKTFSPPSNPRTPDQISVRFVFKYVSVWARALFRAGIFQYIASTPKMTERNSVFKANKQMFTEKKYDIGQLQVAPANLDIGGFTKLEAEKTGDNQMRVTCAWDHGIGLSKEGYTVHLIAFDSSRYRIAGQVQLPLTTTGITSPSGITQTLNVTNFSWAENVVRVFAFITGEENGEPTISPTFSCPIVIED